MIGKGKDYPTGSFLDYDYFKKNYKYIEFKYMLETNSTIYWVLEKSKETILEF